jgi:hypothetical protein
MTAHRPSAGSIQRWPVRPWFLTPHVAAVSSDLGNRLASNPPARLLFRGKGSKSERGMEDRMTI